ncbi:CBS domain-containing protein [Halotalea alkalilenta]|nr:CBS domain-containing protein [Halotalea alkalilenta]
MSRRVDDVMTREVISVKPESTLSEIAGLFTKHSISAAPVCDSAGKVLGIVSERDLLRPFGKEIEQRRDWWLAFLVEGSDPAPALAEFMRRGHYQASLLMTSPAITVGEDASLIELADIMLREGVKRLPVMRDDRLVGIVSRADLVRSISELDEDADL